MDDLAVRSTPAPEEVASTAASDDRPIASLVTFADSRAMDPTQLTRAPQPPGPIVAWRYELPPDGGASEGLEGYAVESSAGERVGSVFVVLKRGPEQYVAVRRSLFARRDVRLLRWANVAAIDHATETVRLARSASELAVAPRLVRRNGTHADDAEAVRVTGRLTVDAALIPDGTERGGSRFAGAFGLSALVFLALLMAVVFASAPHAEGREYALFVVPALVLLGALGVVVALRSRTDQRS
jgi:hypothetical protein